LSYSTSPKKRQKEKGGEIRTVAWELGMSDPSTLGPIILLMIMTAASSHRIIIEYCAGSFSPPVKRTVQ
jgi:hypothetical protein